jgi:hypothetical protein
MRAFVLRSARELYNATVVNAANVVAAVLVATLAFVALSLFALAVGKFFLAIWLVARFGGG